MRHVWRKIYFPLLSVSNQNQFSNPIVYSLIFTYSFTFSQFLLCLVCFAICYFEFSLIFQIHMTYSTIKLTFTVMPRTIHHFLLRYISKLYKLIWLNLNGSVKVFYQITSTLLFLNGLCQTACKVIYACTMHYSNS